MASKYLKNIARPNAMKQLGEEMKRFPSDSKNHEKASKNFKILQDLVNGVAREAARPAIKVTEREMRIRPEGIFNVLPRSATPTVKAEDKRKKVETPPVTNADTLNDSQISKKRKRVDEELSVEISISTSTSVERANKRIKTEISVTTEVERLNGPKTGEKRKRMEEDITMETSSAWKRMKVEMPAATNESVSSSSNLKSTRQIEALESIKGTVADESIDPALAISADENAQQQAATAKAGTKPEMRYNRPICAQFQHVNAESRPLIHLRIGDGPTAGRHGFKRRRGLSTDEDRPGINHAAKSVSKRQKTEAHRQRPNSPMMRKVQTDNRLPR